jgi:hypothetical protein
MRVAMLWVLLAAGCAPLGLYRPGDARNPEVIDVVLHESHLEIWPALVAVGRVGIELTNHGHLEHGVRIVGPGVDEQTDEFLGPEQHRRIWLRLGPGSYRIFCPDGDHATQGMWGRLEVGASPSWFRR